MIKIQRSAHGSVNIGGDLVGDLTINITANDYLNALTARSKELETILLERGESSKRHDAEHAKSRSLTLREITSIRARIDKFEESFEEYVEKLSSLARILSDSKNDIDASVIKRAQDALKTGAPQEAIEILDDLRRSLIGKVELYSDACALSGEISEQLADWHSAYSNYKMAAESNPSYFHLYKARQSAWRLGLHIEATYFAKQLLDFCVKNFGEIDSRTGTAYNELAQSYQTLEEFLRAERFFKKSIEIGKRTIGEFDPRYAVRLNNLAFLYRQMGRYDDAEPLYLEALEIDKMTVGVQSAEYAMHLNNYGMLLFYKGDHKASYSTISDAIEIDRATIGRNAPEYVYHISNLGLVADGMGNHALAIRHFSDSIIEGKHILGDKHPSQGRHYFFLARSQSRAEMFEAAWDNVRLARSILEDSVGDDHSHARECIALYHELSGNAI